MKILKLLLVTSLILVSCKMKYPLLEDGLYAELQTNKGDILLKLHYKEVPVTVANFVSLSEGNHPKVTDSLKGKRYYDGTKFHRVIPNFMIQGGDITGTGKGSAGYRFGDEFPLDTKGKLLLRHDKSGVLSMANSGPATNSSQFFITHKKTNWLDGKHTVFGKIEIGQSVVDSILENDVITKVDIVRVGKSAKKFNAAKVFLEGLASEEVERSKKKAKLDEVKRRFKESKDISKASKTSSGLQYIHLKKGTGVKVDPAKETVVHYTLYNDIGDKIDSSLDRKKPFTFLLSENSVIPGWKEGVKLMNVGGKSRFFVPSHLAYGKVGRTPIIEPDTDLIFEIEVLSVK